MSFPKILSFLVCLVFLLIVGFGFKTYRDMGGFKTIQPHGVADCRLVLGVLSSEDITIDPDTGTAFISGDDRRGTKGIHLPGSIYSYSLQNPLVRPEDLTPEMEFEFHPHGLDLFAGAGNSKLLYVVNHRPEMDAIEIFEMLGSSLLHKESVTDDLLFNANDIVVVDEERFYVTRDHGYSADWARWLEESLRLKKSSVVYYDGQEFRIVAEGLAYANGINLSPDGTRLFVAATLEQTVHVYSRNPDDGSLSYQEQIFTDSGVDNIEVDEEGNLWIGAHPKLLDFLEYSRDPAALSPSQVLRVSFSEMGSYNLEEIFLSDGRYLSGSSVAARWKNHLLIGSVFDRRFLFCQIDTGLKPDTKDPRGKK